MPGLSAMADRPDETKPMNNFDMDGDAGVIRAKSSKAYRFTRLHVCIGIFFVVLIVAFVGTMAGIIGYQKGLCFNNTLPEVEDDKMRRPLFPPSPFEEPWKGIRLPKHIIPSEYELNLIIDVDNSVFNGSVEITVTVRNATFFIVVHVNELEIVKKAKVSTTSGGDSLPIKRQFSDVEGQFYIIEMESKLKEKEVYYIKFDLYRGNISNNLRGLYRSSYTDTDRQGKEVKHYLVASQLQSIDARKVFPCFDEPSFKAKFRVSITYDNTKYRTVLSNMGRLDLDTYKKRRGWKTKIFHPTPVMSTYLLAFVVSNLEYSGHRSDRQKKLSVEVYSQPAMREQRSYAHSRAKSVYKFFHEYFKIDEVLSTAQHVAIPDFSAGAMENWGLVLYRESTLLHDNKKSAKSNKFWVSLIIAHEIAHTWFGNMVTMEWWDDLWLNEGFANTLMYIALDDLESEWKVFDQQLVNNILPVMIKDSLLTSHAVSTQISHPDDIPQQFDSISYDKGTAILRMLSGYLGADIFKEGLRMYVNKYKFKNADKDALWTTFTEAAKKGKKKMKVTEIMDTWTKQMGFPVVTVSHVTGTTYHLNQSRFLLNQEDKAKVVKEDALYGYTWNIPFTYSFNRSQNQVKNQTVMLWRKSENINVPRSSWILGNTDYNGFFRTNYDEELWNKLIVQLKTDHEVFSPANRAGLISDAFNLARADLLNYKIALNITSYLKNEKEYAPWKAFLDCWGFLQGMLATTDSYGLLQKHLYNLLSDYGITQMPIGSENENLNIILLEKLMFQAATSVGMKRPIEDAEKEFKKWIRDEHSRHVLEDFKGVIYAVGVANGGEKEWDYVWNKTQHSEVVSRTGLMMEALAHTQKPWLLWRYARWTLDDSKIRMQDVRNVFRYFASTPLSRMVALQFVLTNWKEINEKFGVDAFLLRDVIYATTSLIHTQLQYEQLDRLYKEHPPAGVASKATENSLALIKANIEWVNKKSEEISLWLKENIPNSDHEMV